MKTSTSFFGLGLALAMLLTGSALAILDLDNNGSSDIWEEHYNATLPADEDPDGDGFTNKQEYDRGTHPLIKDSSAESITIVPDGPNNNKSLFRFFGGIARSFMIEETTDLKDTPWSYVQDDQTGQDAVLPGADTTILMVEDINSDTKFFRIYPLGADPDVDNDQLDGVEESLLNTDPQRRDTDGDSADDGQEYIAGSNPNSISSHPIIWKSASRFIQYDFNDYPPEQGGRYGYLSWWGSWDDAPADTIDIAEAIDQTQIDERLAQEVPFAPVEDSQSGAAFGLQTDYGWSYLLPNPPCYHVTINQRRYWLESDSPVSSDVSKSALVLFSRTVDGEAQLDECQVLSATILAGQTTSSPVDILTNLTEDFSGNDFFEEQINVALLSVEINEVHFDGDKYWELWSDSSGVSQESEVAAEDKFSAPQYIDANGDGDVDDQDEKNHAVAYTRNSKPKIKVELTISGAANLGAIKIKADGSDGITIPETTASVSGDTVSIPLTESTTALPNTIKFYDKEDETKAFKLDWQIKAGNSGWSSIGETEHTVYVTNADPYITTRKQETLFLIGCKNADGETVEDSIISNIWADFVDRDVRRVDGTQLGYYRTTNACSIITTEGLLATSDGTCDSWSKFLTDILRVQGITSAQILLIEAPAVPEFIMITNWAFPSNPLGVSPSPAFPYVNLYGTPDVGPLGGVSWQDDLLTAPSYPWRFTEVIDQTGVPGQDRSNPASIFFAHAVVSAGSDSNIYYDPSYGIRHSAGLLGFELTSIGGYAVSQPGGINIDEPPINYDVNLDGDKTDTNEDSGPALLIARESAYDLNLPEVQPYQ